MLIRLRIVVSKRLTTSKLMYSYKSVQIKNDDNLVKTKSLLFAVNFAIENLSAQLSY